MVRLFIAEYEVDLPENFTIEYTYNSLDVSAPEAIKNSFSKTVAIPSTRINDQIFGDIWRLDRNLIEGGKLTGINFDPRKRVPFTLTRYGGIIESGYIQMNDIKIADGKITYNITCYSGLGDFFYNLMTNEDGTEKTLADLYYQWKPVFSLIDDNPVLTKEEEDTKYIMNISSEVITRSFLNLRPEENTRDVSFVTDDITVIPVYNGYYDDFESDTILVDNYSHTWDGSVRLWQPPRGERLSDSMIRTLQEYMPSQINKGTEDEPDMYAEYRFPEQSSHFWQLSKVEREMEPFEARDLRAHKMNIGLKLSKLMRVISAPENNGGYNVVWDEDITNSPYWNYTWIMLNKPDYDSSDSNKLGNTDLFASSDGTYNQTLKWPISPMNLSMFTNPVLDIHFKPKFHGYQHVLKWRLGYDDYTNKETFDKMVSGASMYKGYVDPNARSGEQMWYKWGSLYTIWKIYDGDTLLKEQHTMIYFGCISTNSNNGVKFGYAGSEGYAQGIYGQNKQIESENTIIARIRDAMRFVVRGYNENAELTFINKPYVDECISLGDSTFNSQIDFVYDSTCAVNDINIKVPLTNTVKNLKITAETHEIGYVTHEYSRNWMVLVDKQLLNEKPGLPFDTVQEFGNLLWNPILNRWNYYIDNAVNYGLFPFLKLDNYKVSVDLNDLLTTTVIEGSELSGVQLHRSTKKIILGGTESPYKYLTDFTKLLNIKYLYHKPTKTIHIMPKDKYHKKEIVDLSDKIDRSKEITIKPILVDTKYITMELENAETYADKIYNTKNNTPYGSFKFNTKYEFNNDIKNIFDDSIYKELIPYRLSSNFFNRNSEMGRLMPLFEVVSHTNTLFKKASNIHSTDDKEDTLYNFLGNETSSFNASAKDEVPKLCLFDSEVSQVDVSNSFVFLNGFYKNFYTQHTGPGYVVFPKTMISDTVPLMKDILGGKECYIWSYNWGYSWARGAQVNHLLMDYSALPLYMPFFSKYLYNKYTPANNAIGTWSADYNIQASWHIQAPSQLLFDPANIEFVTNSIGNIPTISTLADIKVDTFSNMPNDYLTSFNYLYPKFWQSEFEDLYDKNGKQVTLYARIDDEPDDAMRKFYYFDGCYWMITKIDNYNIINKDSWFNKITFVKVKNISSYTNG